MNTEIRLTESQTTTLNTINTNIQNGKKHQIVYIPHGTGKTTISILLAKKLASKGFRVMFFCYKKSLCEQISQQTNCYTDKIITCMPSTVKTFVLEPFDYVFLENPFAFFDDDILYSLEERLNTLNVEYLESHISECSLAQKQLIGLFYLKKILESCNSSTIRFDVPIRKKSFDFSGVDIGYFPVVASESWLIHENSEEGKKDLIASYSQAIYTMCKAGRDSQYESSSKESLFIKEICKTLINEIRQTQKEQKYESESKDAEFIQNMCTNLVNTAEFQKILETTDKIHKEVSQISSKLQSLTDKVTNCQSLIQRQIKVAESDSEKEQLMATFVDECVDKISDLFNDHDNKKQKAKDELIIELGLETWKKLSEDSQNFLLSSTTIFNDYYPDELFDYSTVCLPIIKTLELELKKRFYFDFMRFLSTRYDYEKYPSCLLNQNGKPKKDCHFTLGSFAYLFGIKTDNNTSFEKRKQDNEILIEFCSKNVFTNPDKEIISDSIIDFGTQIEEIKKRYRDNFAHTGFLHMADAKKCRDWIIYSKKLLKKMLDAFRY